MAGTLTVACKIPNGLMLQLFQMEEYDERIMGGGIEKRKRAAPFGEAVKINGPAKAYGKESVHEIKQGAGLTFGVDADHFAAWMEANKDSDAVKKGFIFAAAKTGDAVAQAKERFAEKTGLEQIDRFNLPPEFRQSIATAKGV